MIVVFAASVAMLVVIARRLDRFFAAPGESRATRLTRALLWAIAGVVVVQAGLSALGRFRIAATSSLLMFVVFAVPAAALAVATWRRQPPPEPRAPFSPADVGLGAALIAAFALRLWAGLHKGTHLYDTLSYHLHVPATWLHDGRLTIVPAVFGDPSPAYAPSNLELVFTFLMASMRSDYLAGVGQLPFAALAAAAIVAAVREAGGHRTAALAAALAFLLIPEVWGQMPTAMTDLGLAACLLAALPFALRLYRPAQPSASGLIPFATATGLAVGSKYAGAPLVLPLVAVAAIGIVRGRRHLDGRAGALAGVLVLATGGFWYVRNAVVAGNPLYPVAFPGLPLPALYGAAEMRAWDYHIPVTDLGALASMLVGAGIGFASAAAIALARLWRRIEAWLLVAWLAVFWLVIPYQESRFLFPAFGLAAVVLACSANRPPAAVGWCALAVAIAGALLEAPTRDRLVLVPIGGAAALAAALGRGRALVLPPWSQRALAAGGVVALLFVLLVDLGRHERRPPAYTVGDDDQAAAWAWFAKNVSYANIAYTGTNVPFPLWGDLRWNHVAYVNVAGAAGDRLHDFGPPGDGTAEPAPYRRGASADVWLGNLRAARTNVLFVAALEPIVRRTIAADADGFPIERAWADARPDTFVLRYASPAARVYEVRHR
jgi:4-amino-4-deoxy-L-arabinose transferase-like glycosyltransferase